MSEYFDIFSLILTFVSIQTLLELSKNCSGFWDTKITLKDRDLAGRIAFFLLVPIGVLFHEIGHSLATWQVGGTVEVFRWFIFSGYIVPSGDFSFLEYWWISFAGNLVSIILAILPIPFIFHIRQRIIAEVLYRFIGIQAVYSLVYYPLWSAVNKSGDWRTIYNFKWQPYTSLLLIAHLGLLWGLWQLHNTNKMVQWRLNRHPNTLKKWQELKIEIDNRPNDLQPKLDLVYFLIEHNEIHEAKKIAKKIYRSHFHETSIKVLKLDLKNDRKNRNEADIRPIIKSAQKLLSVALSTNDILILYRILCSSLYRTGNLTEALDYADKGLVIAPDNYLLLYHRANIYRLLKEYQKASADLELALINMTNEDLHESILKLKRQCLIQINLIKA